MTYKGYLFVIGGNEMEYRKRVEKLLLSLGREGMEKLLEWMA